MTIDQLTTQFISKATAAVQWGIAVATFVVAVSVAIAFVQWVLARS